MNASPVAAETENDAPLVDLYGLLDVPRDADTARIRKRIAQLYLEAQGNLGHRNFRRRFYYQELFEIYLPQAHHLLLNEARRAEYDAQLFNRQESELQTTPQKSASTRTVAEREAAEIEALRALLPTQQQLQDNLQDDLVESLAGDHEAQARAEQVVKNRPPRAATPEWARMDAGLVEQRRDAKRRELIKQELIATGRRFGVLAAAVSLAACLLLTIVFAMAFGGEEGAPLFLYPVALALAAIAAFFGAREASRQARRSVVAQLSQMPYEELLRRCGAG